MDYSAGQVNCEENTEGAQGRPSILPFAASSQQLTGIRGGWAVGIQQMCPGSHWSLRSHCFGQETAWCQAADELRKQSVRRAPEKAESAANLGSGSWCYGSWGLICCSRFRQPVCILQHLVPSLEFKLSSVQLYVRTCVMVAKMSIMWRALGNTVGVEGPRPRPDISYAQTTDLLQKSSWPNCHKSLGICHSVW